MSLSMSPTEPVIPQSHERAHVHLRPFTVDPASGEDRAELLAQRVACGWNIDAIPVWLDEMCAGRRLMWFIHLPASPLAESVGTIALNTNDPGNPHLSNGRRMEISSLFIYPQYRRRGLGVAAILEVERIAKELGAEVATMNTSAASRNMETYLRLGYTEFGQREKKYPLDVVLALGFTEEHQYAAFLEKPLA